jgi:hypothetical protein
MDDQLQRLRRWASRGTMPRLYTELALRLAGEGYELELQGEELTIYGRRKPAGWRGWFSRSSRRALLRLVRYDGTVAIPEESADPAFVALLLERVKT